MDFDPPEAVRPVLDRIERFVADVVMPAEPTVMERGRGLGLVENGRVSERPGRSPLGHDVFGCQAPDAGNIEILHKYGTPEQEARWLAPLADGRVIDRVIRLPGALGIPSDTILAHDDVHERGARIYDGPDEVHEMAVSRRIPARYA